VNSLFSSIAFHGFFPGRVSLRAFLKSNEKFFTDSSESILSALSSQIKVEKLAMGHHTCL
jgi:hypothetical protein